MANFKDFNFETCHYCPSLTSKMCTRCEGVYDCGRHINSDSEQYIEHKKYCSPPNLVMQWDNDSAGRMRAYASRELKPGQVIFREYPFICGPSDNAVKANEIPTCLGCCRSGVKKMQACGKCSWPVCSDKCAKTKQHADNECSYLAKRGIKYPNKIKIFREKYFLYKAVYVLRALLLRRRLPEKFEKFMGLPATTAEDSAKEAKVHDTLILKLLSEMFQAGELISSEENISRIIDHLTLYGYRKPFSENPDRWKGQLEAVYRLTSEIRRSCISNVTWSIGPAPDFVLQLTAASTIMKSQELTLELNHDLYSLGTAMRQKFILCTTGSLCDCLRCRDPSELGTFLSAVKCEKCDKGYLVWKNPQNPKSKLICTEDECFNITSAGKVSIKVEELYCEAMENMKTQSENINQLRIKELEEQVKEIKDALHPNHYIIFRLTWTIVRQKVHYLDKYQPRDLCSFFDQCEYLLEIEKCISPIHSQERAELYFYMGRILSVQLQKIAIKHMSQKEALDILDEIMDLFHQARTIFFSNQKSKKDIQLIINEMYIIMTLRKKMEKQICK